jgi:hypothetical protein
MKNDKILSEISIKSPVIGQELKKVYTYALLDPETSLVKARKALELIVCEIEDAKGETLAERIQALNDVLPESVITYMHFIRKLGNSAAHSSENLTEQNAKDAQNILTQLACWHFEIDPEDLSGMKARYFIADPVYRTWAKIAVLTDDGVLYSEYLTFMKPTKFNKVGFDFKEFEAKDFSFGEKEHGNAYQGLREVSFEEAITYTLKSQNNWVKSYVEAKGVIFA